MQGNSPQPHLSPRLKSGEHHGSPDTPRTDTDHAAQPGETARNGDHTWTPVEAALRDAPPTDRPRTEAGTAHDRPNQQLAQHAAEQGLDYTPEAIRKLRSRHGDQGARDHMDAVAALLAYADHVFVRDATIAFTQQQATQTLNRAGGNYDKACALVRRRAIRAVDQAQNAHDIFVNRAWSETQSKEARERHARLTGAYEQIVGSLGHRFTAVLGFLADAELPRDRYRIAATKEVTRALAADFPHPGDQDARALTLRRHPDIGRQIDLYAPRTIFRARIEDLITEACEQLADRVQEGWAPDPAHAAEAAALLDRYWRDWRREHRRAA